MNEPYHVCMYEACRIWMSHMNEWKLQDCVLALSREIMLFIGFPRGTSV